MRPRKHYADRMENQVNTLDNRVSAAHREAFALITSAINNPGGMDLEPAIVQHITSTENPSQAVLDLAQVLVWHAAGALLTHAGSIDGALDLVRLAALEQEMKGTSND